MKGTCRTFFMISTSMDTSTFVCLCLVTFVNIHLTLGKPTFGSRIWCSLFCDEDEYDSSSTTSMEDILDAIFDPCTDCPKRPSSPTLGPVRPSGSMFPVGPGGQPLNFMIPPSNGMNLTMTNTGGAWYMNFVPWAPGAFRPATPAPGVTLAAPRVTAAGPVASATARATTAAKTGTTAKGTATTTAKP